MAKKKSKSASQAIADAAQALSLTESKSKDRPSLPPKGKDELELEKLVFGDLTGFQDGLREGLDDDYDMEKAYSSESEAGLVPLSGDRDVNALHDDELFYFDTGPGAGEGAGELVRDAEGDVHLVGADDLPAPTGPPPKWEDSDDERVLVSLTSQNKLRKYRETFEDDVVTGTDYIRRLRTQHERVYPVPKWALPQPEKLSRRRRRSPGADDDASSSSSSSDIEDNPLTTAAPLSELLQSTSGYIRSSPPTTAPKFRPGKLDISRLRDANHLSPSHSSVGSLSFHPTHPLLMSSGFDHTMRLYHIDGKVNPPVTSLYLPSTPIVTAAFHPDGKRVFAAGRRPFFYIWNLETGSAEKVARIYGHKNVQRSMEYFKLSPCGNYMAVIGSSGIVNILSATTSQWIATAQIDDGQVADMEWYSPSSSSSPGLTIASLHGEIWEYDLTARSFSSRWLDEGGVNTSKIALSSGNGDKYLAVGSASGIVNVYDRKKIMRGEVGLGETMKPIRALGSLVTRIGDVTFSGDGQVLCIASKAKKDALRLAHIPSCTVYQNWPTSATPLGKVDSVAFSPVGAGTNMLAVGNEAGKIRLWEIRP